ncbi:MAG: sugar ABC transporter substrate-binding protein [Lentisphaerae bacterium]|nr:sugar ABC transporter substrate-binding protein [Lentisphaerota bacterium]
MRKVFGAGFLLFLLLYAGAQLTRDRVVKPGITTIRWCTDLNPARSVQTALFQTLNPDVEVVLDPGARQKLIVQCATGTGPDVIDIFNADDMAAYVDSGILLDLTDVAKAKGFGIENTYPAVHGGLVVAGRQYRYPCNVSANAVIYNRAIFDDHGVPYPDANWTYDQFIEAGRLILTTPSKSGAKHIPVANFISNWFYLDLLVGYGGSLYRNQGLLSALDSPEAIDAMQFYRDLMYRHRVITTPTEAAGMTSQGGWGSGGLNWFSSERAAMIFIGRWYLCQVPNYPALKGKLGAARLPRVGDRPSSGRCNSRAAGINVNSPHREESIRFLQYLASPEYGRVIVQDGDSMPPNPALAQSGLDLTNAVVSDPAFHQVFVDALRDSRSLDSSPFIDPSQVIRWLNERIGLVENDRVMPEEAMRALAKEVNETIRLNLERRPDLQRKYQEVTGKAYRSDWWQ